MVIKLYKINDEFCVKISDEITKVRFEVDIRVLRRGTDILPCVTEHW